VVLSALLASVASLLCGRCNGGDTSASSQPTSLVLVEATEPAAQAAPAPPPTPAVVGEGQPEGKTPTIEFAGPRPPQFPFRMDLTRPPEPPLVITGTPFSQDDVAQAQVRRVLEREFKKYPPGVLYATVGAVLVFNTLKVNERLAAGTYTIGLVFIAAGEHFVGEAWENDIAQTLHHEVSSLLLFQNFLKFDKQAFDATLPEKFVYIYDRPGANTEAPYTSDDFIPSLALLSDGFLVPWAMRNLEQDFNSYAEILLWRPELLLRVFAPDSAVGRKARVVRDFYIAIDKRFEAVFAPAGE